jgi:hypothetical protein
MKQFFSQIWNCILNPINSIRSLSIKTKYFLLAVVIIGSIGIWLPILIECLFLKKITISSIPQNIITYFITILFAGSIDYFFSQLKKLKVDGLASIFLDLIGLLLLSLAIVLIGVFLSVYNHSYWSLIVGFIGVVIAYRIWWLANVDNPNFYPKPVSSLGSDPSTPLANG